MIEFMDISRRYGSVQALNHVSFSIGKGSVVGLLGQNGAGKTTLLKILTGYLAPTEGRVLINGKDPLLQPEEAKSHIGYLPEQPPLYDEMTVREYLTFSALLHGVKKKSVASHVDEIMSLTGLTDMSKRLISHLSKGYRQRAGFAQALCGDPDVLVLDEPTVGLDPKQITEIRSLIQTLSRERTILFSSHILSEVEQLCTHVVILDGGEVKLNSKLADLQNPQNGQVFLSVYAPQQAVLPALKGLNGVEKVSVLPKNAPKESTFLLTFSSVQQPELSVSELLYSMNIPILSLYRKESSLESIFLNVISGENPVCEKEEKQ